MFTGPGDIDAASANAAIERYKLIGNVRVKGVLAMLPRSQTKILKKSPQNFVQVL
ncbi:hypothetical protein D3C73_1617170 [compost metagenome]